MTIQIVVHERTGTCRWCGCTEREPCEGGCGWANRAQTLCTACVNLDREARTVAGRRRVAALYQTGELAE